MKTQKSGTVAEFKGDQLRQGLARVRVDKTGAVTKRKPADVPSAVAAVETVPGGSEKVTAKPQDGISAGKGLVRRAPKSPSKKVRDEAKAVRQQHSAAVLEAIHQITQDMIGTIEEPGSALHLVEVLLDGSIEDPVEQFAEHQDWIKEALSQQDPAIRQAAWFAMYKGSFSAEFRSHEELDVLLQWLVEQKRLECLGKVSKGCKSQGDIFHFGTDYKFCSGAGLSDTQVKALRSAVATARGKIWRIVNARWKAAPAEMRSAMEAEGMALTVQQLVDEYQGDCLLRVPGKWSTSARGRRYIEGGLLLVRSTGVSCTVWMASNELRRADGTKAWGNFEWWFSQNVMAHDEVEAVTVPMNMILDRVKPSYTRNKVLAARNLACQRIRDGIRYERENATKKPTKPAEPKKKRLGKKKATATAVTA